MDAEPPDDLAIALRSIDGLPGVRLQSGARWEKEIARWRFEVSLEPSGLGTRWPIPNPSRWMIDVEGAYPFGDIEVHPALAGGIELTFPHQLANHTKRGQRSGKVCVGMHDAVLGRLTSEPEPHRVEERLRWHIERLTAWIVAASNDDLVHRDDPWELPDFSPSRGIIVSGESYGAHAAWEGADAPKSGYVDMTGFEQPTRRYIGAFRDATGDEFASSPWGTYIRNAPDPARGPWFRLTEVPVIPPWAAPATWGEFRDACADRGVDLDAVLGGLLAGLRSRPARGGGKRPTSSPIGLVGFPIPLLVGGPDAVMHWQGFYLPQASGPKSGAPGSRTNSSNLWAFEGRSRASDTEPVMWVKSENWNIEQISSRGALAEEARRNRIAVIGAGTLASILTETLVRLGIRDVLIVDHDHLHGGNLVRHTLTLHEVEAPKARSLAARLNVVHPAVTASALPSEFPNLRPEGLAAFLDCDVILDTTGSDDVIKALSDIVFPEPVTFVSVSLAADAEKLFAFASHGESIPAEAFWDWWGPIAETERLRLGPNPMEGAGCWHPVMPARWDRIISLVGTAIPWVEKALIDRPMAPIQTILDVRTVTP